MDKHVCPLDCPNRSTKLGKGYSFLFAIALTTLLAWQSCDVKYTKTDGLELKTRDTPIGLLIASFFLIAGSLGMNTDPIAERLGKLLSK